MKKKSVLRKVAVLLAVLLIASLSLSACGKKDGSESGGSEAGGSESAPVDTSNMSVEDIIIQSTENFKEVESMTYAMKMEMSMSVLGTSMDMVMDADCETIIDPVLMHVVATNDMGSFGTNKTEVYGLAEDGGITVYTGMDMGDGEVSWMKSKEDMDMSSIQQYDSQASMDMYVDHAASFTEAGKETIEGKEVTRYDGSISGDDIATAIEESGVGSQLGVTDTEDLDTAALFKDSGSIPISIWIDDSLMVVKYRMDMSEVMGAIMNSLMEAELGTLEGEEAEAMELGMTVDKMITEITVTGINNVESIEIPPEVIDSAEDISQ